MLDTAIRVDLVDLALLCSIGFVAAISAINARGALRITLSWLLAVPVLVICAVFGNIKVQEFKNSIANPPKPAPMQEKPVVDQPPPPPPAGESPEELANYLEESKKIVMDGQGIAYSISIFDVDNLSNASDELYEKMESKARSLRNQSTNIERQAKQLRVPPKYNELNNNLVEACESLRLAGFSVHAYFGSEDAQEEAQHRNQFTSSSRKAIAAFKELQRRLEAER